MSDRILRFPDRTWDELEGLPSHFGTPPTGRSFTCSKNQSRRLPSHFPKLNPLPGTYRLHLPFAYRLLHVDSTAVMPPPTPGARQDRCDSVGLGRPAFAVPGCMTPDWQALNDKPLRYCPG